MHLVPRSWEDEVMLLERELARAHAALRLEEQRNRGLPQISPVTSAAQYERRADESVTKYVGFLKKHDVLPVHAYTDAEIRKRKGEFVPPETRHFFAIATHHEPMTLYTHFYHWWDLAQMRERPHASPITCWASSSSSTCASRATARATSRASTCSRS